MRIAIFGGTNFIGWHLSRELAAHGHELLIVHRGTTEPDGLPPDAVHLHLDRSALPEASGDIQAFGPEVVVDTLAMSREGAESAVRAVPASARVVMWSSIDVYEAYGALTRGECVQAVPFDETAPVRSQRYPYAASGNTTYEKLDAEEVYLARGATVLRLAIIYGPRDPQRREEFVLRRVRAGRRRIPVGSGAFTTSRCFAPDVAALTRLVCERDDLAGEVFHACEPSAWPMRAYVQRILEAAGSDAELVRVPEEALPPDLGPTASIAQHLLASPAKAMSVVGWAPSEPVSALEASVRWHLEHPPPEADEDFTADDAALERASESR